MEIGISGFCFGFQQKAFNKSFEILWSYRLPWKTVRATILKTVRFLLEDDANPYEKKRWSSETNLTKKWWNTQDFQGFGGKIEASPRVPGLVTTKCGWKMVSFKKLWAFVHLPSPWCTTPKNGLINGLWKPIAFPENKAGYQKNPPFLAG